MSSIPDATGLTTKWLSAQLQRAGFDVVVAHCHAEAIGTGQIGKCLRLTLRYTGDAGDAPSSLIAKLPSDDPQSRMTGVMLRNYLKEVRFYQQLQKQLSIRTPRCFYAEINGEGPEFLLLLEDLHPAEQGDQLQGTNIDVARAALTELVGLHAPSWNDDALAAYEWLGAPAAVSTEALAELYKAQLPGFMERYGAQLAQEERDIIRAFGDGIGRIAAASLVPQALIHVDFRLDNLLINSQTRPPEVTTVDWQSITLGAPLNDVAYFIGAGLRAAVRRPAEQQLVQDYYQALCAAGVEGYGWDACWRDYRRGTFAGFSVTVVASMLVQQTARGDEMFLTMARRHSRHALDHEAQGFL
ncbi:MAG: phosphotransferase [Pseudomonadales bacterium]